MQTQTQKICQKLGEMPVFQWRVASKSEKGKYRIISYYKTNIPKLTVKNWYCNCPGFPTARKNGHFCKHIRIALHQFSGLTIDTDKEL